MKNVIVLASAAILIFTACNGKSNGNTDAASSDGPDTAASVGKREVSNQIAYIRLDTLMAKYDMFTELGGALEEKMAKAEKDLTAKGRNLERQVADFYEKVEKGLLTRAQAGEQQEKLQQQEQSLLQQQETVRGELAEENQVMMNNLYHSIEKFMSEFNKDYKYGVILTTSGGSPIIHADPLLDITDIVVKGLNEQYGKDKAANASGSGK